MKALIFFADAIDGIVLKTYEFDAKVFPFLSQIMHNSCINFAESAITDSSFMTMYTGLKLDEHKVSFYGSGGDRKAKMANFTVEKLKQSLNIKYIWEYFNDDGFTVGLFALPLTSPSFVVDGWILSGSPYVVYNKKENIYPDKLFEFFDGYNLRIPGRITDDINKNKEWIQMDMNYCKKVLSVHPIDILFMYQAEYDDISHAQRGREKSNNKLILQLLEWQLSQFYEQFEFEHFFMISDHGFKKARGEKLGHGPHYREGIFCYHGPIKISLPKQINNYELLTKILEILNINKTPEESVQQQLEAMGYIDTNDLS